MATECQLLHVRKDILLFTLSVISDILTEPTQLLPVMA